MDGIEDDWLLFWVELGIAIVIAIAVVASVEVGLHVVGRRSEFAEALRRRIRWPLTLTAPLAAMAIAVTYLPDPEWADALGHLFGISVIATGAWHRGDRDRRTGRDPDDLRDRARPRRQPARLGRYRLHRHRPCSAIGPRQRVRRRAARVQRGIRVADAVVVDQQWGRVHEITLSYVVVVPGTDASWYSRAPGSRQCRSRTGRSSATTCPGRSR